MTKQPGDEGARHGVILSLLVDPSLFIPTNSTSLKTTCLHTQRGVYGHTCKWSAWSMSSTTSYCPTILGKLKESFTQALHEVLPSALKEAHDPAPAQGDSNPPFLKVPSA